MNDDSTLNQGLPSRYSVIESLGRGASGAVFLCFDESLKRQVAVKCLRDVTNTQIISFQREAKALCQLHHPNIISVLDFGAAESAPYMVMDYVQGISLEQYLNENESLDPARAIDLFEKICHALGYAHDAQILHRDVKVSNVLIRSDSVELDPVIIDFGVARFMTGEVTDGSGYTIAGTPLYMAPDMMAGKTYDVRSEIYSLGCLMFETIAGRPPFEADSALSLASLHAHEVPETIAQASQREDVPLDLEAIVARCLAKNPDDRFQSISDLTNALKEIDLNWTAKTREQKSLEPRRKREQPVLLYAMMVAAFAIIGIFGTFIMLQSKSTKTEVKLQVDSLRGIDTTPGAGAQSAKVRQAVQSKRTDLSLKLVYLDDDLKSLEGYRFARFVDLTDSSISDLGTSYLLSSPLRVLKLSRTNVETLEFVAKMKSLRELDLIDTSINDESIGRIKNLPQLQTLKLSKTNVSAKCASVLSSLPSLSHLELGQTSFSLQDLDDLARRMPYCEIVPHHHSRLKDDLDAAGKLCSENRRLEGQKLLNQATREIEKGSGVQSPALVPYLAASTVNLFLLNREQEANKLADRALSIARPHEQNQYVAGLTAVKAGLFVKARKWTEALAYAEESVKLSRQEELSLPERASAELTLGSAQCMTKRYKESEETFMRTEEMTRSFDAHQTLTHVVCLNSLGQLAMLRDQKQRAWSLFWQAAREQNDVPIRSALDGEVLLCTVNGLIDAARTEQEREQAANFKQQAIASYRAFDRTVSIDTLERLMSKGPTAR